MKRRHWQAVFVILLAACSGDDADSRPPVNDASSDAWADSAGRGGSAGLATGGSGGIVDAAADTGRGGTAGSGGSGGASGAGGTAGLGGAAGIGGASGTGGAAGTSGAAGAGGAAGTGGAAGGSGASGSSDSGATDGNAGTSGAAGASGAGGTGGSNADAQADGADGDASVDDAADGDASVDDAAGGDASVDNAADAIVDQVGTDTSSDAPANDGASCPICVAGATCQADAGVCVCPSGTTGDGTTTGTGCKPKPELLWYRFDGTGTSVPNLAISPPAGAATATIMGGLSQGGAGQCGGAIIGSGVTSTTDYVNTGWATSLTGTSWTISFWTADVTPSTTLFYIFGDPSAGSFRCFTNGVAGPNNWILRGDSITDVLLTGGATVTSSFATFVYDSVANQIRAYLNGVLVNTVAQGPLTITGTGPFKVIGWSDRIGMANGGKLDEFRVYNRALSPAEIADLASPICP